MDRTLRGIQRALDASNTPETLQDVIEGLKSGEFMLWQDAPTETVVITQPVWPEEMNTFLYAGSMRPMGALIASCEAWCREVGIKRMTVTDARKGWARVLGEFEYRDIGDGVLMKEL